MIKLAEIIIYLNQRKLHFYKDKSRFNAYPVAIGKPSAPTPTGLWKVDTKILNPGGILGTRWMGLNIPTPEGVYGIHGTSQPSSIGKAVSLGCIRMFNHDVEEIFPLTPLGTTVEIVRNMRSSAIDQERGGTAHAVKRGDTLWRIAREYGIPLDTLLEANHLSEDSPLTVGTPLLIPLMG